jgi:HEXXH motif-containing protein
MLLFDNAVDKRTARNPGSQRLTSPLRSDRRPMDAVFHATPARCRVYLLCQRLLERDPQGVPDLDSQVLEKKIAQMASFFDDGARTIADKANLTLLGEKVLRSSLNYMSHDAAA